MRDEKSDPISELAAKVCRRHGNHGAGKFPRQAHEKNHERHVKHERAGFLPKILAKKRIAAKNHREQDERRDADYDFVLA